ncbi:MAG TPA: hypothetical protein VL053_05520 [Arachidicoccus sp.]|nr:hypothetical protein [Arachidicoccus sp.]
MNIDRKTLYDLGIFSRYEQESIFHYIDFTTTSGGKDWLHHFFERPLSDVKEIQDRQALIRHLGEFPLPPTITNGTMMVMDKFFYSPVTNIPDVANLVNVSLYKTLNRPDYVILRYSLGHIARFINGMAEIYALYAPHNTSTEFEQLLGKIGEILEKPFFKSLASIGARIGEGGRTSARETIRYTFKIYRSVQKNDIKVLEEAFFKIDAWCSMAKAVKAHGLIFPEILTSNQPHLVAEDLYHPILENPVGYGFSLTNDKNFLFLTGANMAGKSTFIRAVGIALYLAALGMGVPAKSMQASTFDGILSNIDVTDNTMNGESYFFNEVQRVKTIVEKIKDGSKWLILIDELFKGTNIVDAMKCSTTVVEGLRKVSTSLFVLSTHLYEIGNDLKRFDNIQFRYFETQAIADNLIFSYKLKEGISDDRLGYLILKREKVAELLDNL